MEQQELLKWLGQNTVLEQCFEYPTIVDIDADGSAEILLAGGRDATWIEYHRKLDNLWAPARKIWNQYAYSITNVNDDGTIPVHPTPNWLTWNSFRAGNSETKVGLELPDLELGEPLSVQKAFALKDLLKYIFP